jgi:signal transduction histidine kinase/CheY-like chemotaxis protein
MEVDISASVIEVGSRDAILIMVRDVTERARAEQQRRALERDLREARRLESLGVLAGGVAHDFNNLLAAILGHADLALRRLPADSPAREYLEQIITASRSAAGLTRQMLTYAGGGSMSRERIDLADLAAGVVRMMAVTVGRHARLRTSLEPHPPEIIGDRALLAQLLMNLVTNAADAVGEREGEIIVAAYETRVDPAGINPAHASPEFAGGVCVCLEVRDTGQGMPEGVRERMFEPFFSTKFTGRGLGLSAALGTVRSHLGAIEVTSREGEGTTIRVYFPPAAGEAPRATGAAAPPAARYATPADGAILVVDDDPLVRGVVAATLGAAGRRVVECGDGEQAVGVASDAGLALAAAVVDLTMPGLDGVEVAGALRERRPGLPLVIMSGYSDLSARDGPGRIPGAVFLPKPFSADELLGAIDRAMLAGASEAWVRA